ncbi:MAG: hypothetical protein ACOYEV_03865 [Candidatus Nanopelagicales bacterium]
MVALWIPLHVWQEKAQYEALIAAGAAPPLAVPGVTGAQWAATAMLAAALTACYLFPLRRMHRAVITRSVAYR